ncbi:MAG TPA: glycosyltransferase family 39 protein, partial [Ktedonobacteraceae bacterium]|nr:glycosyltransferase family 39 protein [Ktedonobacteraceae bacterium]
DEVLSVNRAQQSVPTLFQIVSVTQPNMALYYFLLHFWLGLVGFLGIHPTEAVVRFPSALFATLDTLLLYFLARRFFSTLIAGFAALLYLLNTLQLTYAQETRAYTLQLFFIGLSWFSLCVLFSSDLSAKRARKWWICFCIASILAMYTQLFSEIVLATQAVVVGMLCLIPTIWRRRVRRQLRPLILSWICIGLFIVPILYASRVGSKTGWLPIPQLGDVYHLFLTINSENKVLFVLTILLLLVGLSCVLLAKRARGTELLKRLSFLSTEDAVAKSQRKGFEQYTPLALLLIGWLFCPVIITYVVSQFSTHLFSPRYLVVVVPAFVLLIALCVSLLRWRRVQVVLSLLLVLLCLISVPGYYASAQVEDWRTGSLWLQQHYQVGDGLICYNTAEGCAVSIEYYLQAYPYGSARFDADSPGYFPWVDYDTSNHLGDYKVALNLNAIQAYGNQHPRLFFALGRAAPGDPEVRPVMDWLNAHYKLIDQVNSSTLTVYLFDTTAYQPHLV